MTDILYLLKEGASPGAGSEVGRTAGVGVGVEVICSPGRSQTPWAPEKGLNTGSSAVR